MVGLTHMIRTPMELTAFLVVVFVIISQLKTTTTSKQIPASWRNKPNKEANEKHVKCLVNQTVKKHAYFRKYGNSSGKCVVGPDLTKTKSKQENRNTKCWLGHQKAKQGQGTPKTK